MKNRMFLVGASIMGAAGVFANEVANTTIQVVDATTKTFTPKVLSLPDKMTLLVLQIGLILFMARLGGFLAKKYLNLPSVLGELGAGILIGPWALGGLPLGKGILEFGLFRGAELAQVASSTGTVPFAVTPELYGICTLASIILLFLSGLETNIGMFFRYAFAGSLVGLGGVIFSFLFGDLCAVYAVSIFPDLLGNIDCLQELHQMVLHGDVFKAILSPSALFMGIMSTATSVGITARILSEQRKMDSEEGVTIMAGAVIDDVLGIIVLAIGMAIIASQKGVGTSKLIPWGKIGSTAIDAFGVWLGGTIIGVLFSPLLARSLHMAKSGAAIATMAFGVSLVVAALFECAGLSLIIGAYVIGLALSRTDVKTRIIKKMEPIYLFMVPVFFCVMGMMVNVRALLSKPVLIFGAIYTILAIVAKIIGCALPAKLCGFNWLGSFRVGAGMIPRGEVALIIAGIGLANNYLNAEIFGIGILMTLITTIVSPPLLVALFKPKREGINDENRKGNTKGSHCFTRTFTNYSSAKEVFDNLLDEFGNEGFVISCLNKNEHIYEILRHNVEISMRLEDNVIYFESSPKEEFLIYQAWTEMKSDMIKFTNDIIKAESKDLIFPVPNDDFYLFDYEKDSSKFKKWLYNILNKYFHNTSNNILKPSKLQRLLIKTFIENNQDIEMADEINKHYIMIPNFKAYSKHEAIEKLIEVLANTFPKEIIDKERIRLDVFEREKIMSTGLNDGLAVPHARSNGVKKLIGVIALIDNSENENGIIPDYDTVDHSKIQCIALSVSPKSANTPFLQVMALITKVMHNSKGRSMLLNCKTPEEMRDLFTLIK